MARKSVRDELSHERRRVERLVAEAGGSLLAGRLRPLGEERAQHLAGLRTAPPVLADLVDQVRAQLRVANPRTQVVRRVEAGVHVCEVAVTRIADARRS